MFHPEGPTFFELARQALSSTRRGYDLLAPKFDLTPFRTPDLILQATRDVMLATEPERPSLGRVVDVCCGTGAGIATLRPHCEKVVGVDFSKGMLDVAKAQSPGWAGTCPVEFVLSDVLEFEPPEERFDAAVCFGALGHFVGRQEREFLDAVRGMLRPGGRFYFPTTERRPWWSLGNLLSRGFNAAMHVRNAIWRPPFIMYYLTFLLPDVVATLEGAGFEVTVRTPPHLPSIARRLRVVEARRPD